jgi:hypothetical protein
LIWVLGGSLLALLSSNLAPEPSTGALVAADPRTVGAARRSAAPRDAA